MGVGPGAAAAGSPAIACAWCAAPFDESTARLAGRAVCGRCGAETTDPQPTEAELDHAYGDWYRPGGGRFAGPLDLMLARARAWPARRIDEIAPPGPVLDVGSGDGTMLRALRARGREATGVEREPSGDGVVAGDVRELDGEWAAIVFWHSLEHLRDAGAALEHAVGLLAPGAVLVIAIPDRSALQARAFGERWLALDLPRHLVHVPGAALLASIRGHGLELVRVSHWRGGQVVFGWLHGLVGALSGIDLYDAIRRPAARRARLGAGRRALALALAVALAPVALAAAAVEVAAGRSASLYVEARRG